MSNYESRTGRTTGRVFARRNISYSFRLKVIIIAGVVVFAAVVGTVVYFALGLNIRNHQTCEVLQIGQPTFAKAVVWEIKTTCGTHAINSSDFLETGAGERIVDSLTVSGTYNFTFSGNDLDIIAAAPADQ